MMMKKKPFAYSKVDKEDPEELNHRRAQFLIQKMLEQVEVRRKPSYLRIRIRKLKIKIGKKLTKLRKNMLLSLSTAKLCVSQQVFSQFKSCKRMFNRGDRNIANLSPLFS